MMSQFFHMGGYSTFVWTSYGVAVSVLALNIVFTIKKNKSILNKIRQKAEHESRA